MARHPVALLRDIDVGRAERMATADLRALARQDWGRERLALDPRAVHVWCPAGVIDSAPLQALHAQPGESWTARNRAKVEKLAELAAR